jgi:DNA-binding winged helix-turn-helix (wHTH) protein/Tol biopolymer transport system component
MAGSPEKLLLFWPDFPPPLRMNDLSSPDLLHSLPPDWRRDAPRRIGAFVVHAASNEIAGPAGVQRLRPRLMDVLLRLAVEPGAVVSRHRLLDEVWPRRMVSDEVLSRTIAELRTALGDDPRHPAYIETIPTVGYRLVAAIGDATPPLHRSAGAAVTHLPDPCNGAAVEPPRDADTPAPQMPAPLPAAAPAPRGRRGILWIGAALALVALAIAAIGWLRERPADDLVARIAGAAPLISDTDLAMQPRYSPDGTRLAFASSRELDAPAHIVVADLDGRDHRRVIEAAQPGVGYESPVFVGSGERIAYLRCAARRCSIVARDVAGGTEQVLVDEAQAPQPIFDVSADGRYLVYARRHRPQFPSSLALLDLRAGTTHDLTLPSPDVGDDEMPRFSPDAGRIAFLRGGRDMAALWTVSRQGGDAAAAANAMGMAFGAAWRDARHVLVAADWFGYRSLNDVDLAAHAARFVGGRGARYPDIAPSGAIVFENARFRADLWSFDVGEARAASAPSWPSTRFTMNPAYSPDGARVAFVSNREGAEAIFVAARGAAAVKLGLPAGHRYVNAHWSSDGGALYVVRLGMDPPHPMSVVRFDFASGATTPLDALGADVAEVFADAAGRDLYFGVIDGQVLRLARAPLADLRARERLPLPAASSFMVDGAHIAFTQPQIRGLTLCTLPDLACEALPLPLDDATAGAWVLRGNEVWYRDAASEPAALVRYDLATRRETLRAPFAPMAYGRALAAAPDGREVLVMRGVPPQIDLMIAR